MSFTISDTPKVIPLAAVRQSRALSASDSERPLADQILAVEAAIRCVHDELSTLGVSLGLNETQTIKFLGDLLAAHRTLKSLERGGAA